MVGNSDQVRGGGVGGVEHWLFFPAAVRTLNANGVIAGNLSQVMFCVWGVCLLFRNSLLFKNKKYLKKILSYYCLNLFSD